MNEISEDISNEELNKLFLVKIQFREKTRLSTTWRCTILERTNSEHALFESQRELVSQKLQLLKDIHWTDQVQRETKNLCSELKMQECNARSCQEFEELKMRSNQEENTQKQRRLEEFLMQRDQEDFQNYWKILRTQKSSTILTHRAVMTVPAFFIKLLSPRVQESLAAILECCEIHERI